MALHFPKHSLWQKIFTTVITENISDIHLSSEARPHLRSKLSLIPCGEEIIPASLMLQGLKEYFLTPEQFQNYLQKGQLDFRCTYAGHSFRGNVFSTTLGPAMALRKIPQQAYPLNSYPHHPTLWELITRPRGLILICGATGTGKSSTLAALLEAVNQNLAKHIITLEDPLEYAFTSNSSLIQQRELGKDFTTFSTGIRAALRQDPDLLMVGEIRDTLTMEATLEAAETGHLVLGTLHASSTIEAIGRIIAFFPPAEQDSRRQQLAQVLQGLIAQQLLYHQAQIHCVMEILISTPAIANLIRQGKDQQILTQMQLNKNLGMITMAEALKKLS